MSEIHVHHHHHWDDEAPSWVGDLKRKLDLVLKSQEAIMSVLTDLQTTVDAIGVEVPTIATGVSSIEATLAALQNSTTSTFSPADAAAVTSMQASVVTIKTSLDAIAASLPAPAPAPAKPAGT
jgi:hypothetical protein